VPWPERSLSVLVRSPWRPIAVRAVHMPTGVGWGFTKIETFEAVYHALGRRTRRARILCGDFNSPQEELPDGRVVSFAYQRRENGTYRLRPERGERWDNGELNVIVGLRRFDLGDVYRTLYGHKKVAYSWYPRWSHNRGGRRFDHIFASASLVPKRCAYLPRRKRGLSNHRAVEAAFALEAVDRLE
jgi:exodeoxyribonuclease III